MTALATDVMTTLLRAVDASPLGRVTLRRALCLTGGDRQVIRQAVDDGYVSVHTTEDRMEVGLGRTPFVFLFPDAYILLPTPKIRKVLGARS